MCEIPLQRENENLGFPNGNFRFSPLENLLSSSCHGDVQFTLRMYEIVFEEFQGSELELN